VTSQAILPRNVLNHDRGDLKEIEEELEESYDNDQDEDSGKEEP
jgi:hypothetical protein